MTSPGVFADLDRRRVLAWASYDWANSAYTTTVMAGLLPVFFADYWSTDSDVEGIDTYRLGVANSVAGLIIALTAPLLGAIADRGGVRKRLLATFAFLGVLMTSGLALAGRGEWELALTLYVLGTLGFSGANVFYDSLLGFVSPRHRLDVVSAIGFAAGYLGGGLLFAVNVAMVTRPEWFGLADATTAVRASFVTVAVWWGLFTLPLLRHVDEPGGEKTTMSVAVRSGMRQLWKTLKDLRQHRAVVLFLVGYWLYIDGVDTIVRMAGNYGAQLGLPREDLITALLVTQFIGFPATIAYGFLGQRIGARRGIVVAIAVYAMVTVWGAYLDTVAEFYTLAVVIGLVQGGVQSLSRSLFQRIIPPDQAAQFFGFYNMLGKFAVVIGPLIMGVVARVAGERASILSLLPLFIIGGILVLRVPDPG